MKNFFWTIITIFGMCAINQANAQDVPDGDYYIVSLLNPDWLLSNSGSNPADGSNVHIWHFDNTDGQRWSVRNLRDGWVTIHPINGRNKAIDNVANVIANKNNITIWEVNGSTAQIWKTKKNFDDTYMLLNGLDPKYVINLADGILKDGNNIELYKFLGEANQMWRFVPVDKYPVKVEKDGAGNPILNGHTYYCVNGDILMGLEFSETQNMLTGKPRPEIHVCSRKVNWRFDSWSLTQPDPYLYDNRKIQLTQFDWHGTVSRDGKTIEFDMDGNKYTFHLVK